MKRNRKLGTKFSTFLTLKKEVYPHFMNGGTRKERQGLFQCTAHPEAYYLVTYRQARQQSSKKCLCEYKDGLFYGGFALRKTLQDVEEYSYSTNQQRHLKAMRDCHPSWFKVEKHRLLVNGDIFYEFEGKKDYVLAKKIEDVVWNSLSPPDKSYFLARFSYEMDKMHRDGEITFDSMLWKRGAGVEFFKEYLDE